MSIFRFFSLLLGFSVLSFCEITPDFVVEFAQKTGTITFGIDVDVLEMVS